RLTAGRITARAQPGCAGGRGRRPPAGVTRARPGQGRSARRTVVVASSESRPASRALNEIRVRTQSPSGGTCGSDRPGPEASERPRAPTLSGTRRCRPPDGVAAVRDGRPVPYPTGSGRVTAVSGRRCLDRCAGTGVAGVPVPGCAVLTFSTLGLPASAGAAPSAYL